MNDMYRNQFQSLTRIEPVFKEIGIKPQDKVISLPDFTINGSLYFMNRKGYTEFGSDFSKEETFNLRIKQGARFLIINDSTILNRQELKPFIQNKVGEYENVLIYDLDKIDLTE